MARDDRMAWLRLVAQETRGNLIQDILGHPRVSPTFDELVYVNPSKGRTTIREHLGDLEEAGIIDVLRLDEEEQEPRMPYTFYSISEDGYRFLNEHNLFVDELDEIRSDYERVSKPDRIKKWENAPRPPEVEQKMALLA
jgi:DNA-binding transcriptional ArsR family regulator